MPRGRACAWRSVPTCARGDNSPAACSVGWGYHPRETVVRVRPPALQTQRRRRLTQRSRTTLAMPTHADSTHPTIQPLRYTTPPGLFGVYMRSSALAYFRQHGASDYHQTATRVSTSRTFYQQIPTVVYGRSGATTRPLSHNGPHTYT